MTTALDGVNFILFIVMIVFGISDYKSPTVHYIDHPRQLKIYAKFKKSTTRSRSVSPVLN